MKVLVVLRGFPASGKSSFIRENKLEAYTIEPDKIREQYGSITYDCYGNSGRNINFDSIVWKHVNELLKFRMERGLFTVIDATHLSKQSLQDYKQLIRNYRYNIVCVDFTKEISFEKACKYNSEREEYKRLSQKDMERMNQNYLRYEIPSYIKSIISPKDFKEFFELEPYVLDEYNKIHIIGDIHGCYGALMNYFKKQGGIKEDECYMFTGDYLDRGIQNKEVLEFLLENFEKENFYFLEGNHEKHIRNWANGETIYSNEFKDFTIKQISENIKLKRVRAFCYRLKPFVYFQYNSVNNFVSHGGVATIKDLAYMGEENFIRGMGNYEDVGIVQKSFFNNAYGTRQFHGHRNISNDPIRLTEDKERVNSFNLEGQVEMGGCLRAVTIDKNDNIEEFYIKNDIYNKERFDKRKKLLREMRSSKDIKEKTLENNISSFNFTREVFYDKSWNERNIKARGLFINTNNGEIVARGYNKFFNIGEFEHNQIHNLYNKTKFPINLFEKYNGFLGLIGYNREKDELFFSSKSTNQNEHTDWFKEIIKNQNINLESVKEYLKITNNCMVFEVLDGINDEHTIENNGRREVVLLDILERTENFNPIDYYELRDIGERMGLRVKRLLESFYDFKSFVRFYNKVIKDDYLVDGKYIEGFVCVDSENNMHKIKLPYYNLWKRTNQTLEILTHLEDKEEVYDEALINLAEKRQSIKPVLDFVRKNKLYKMNYKDIRKRYYKEISVDN